MSEKVGDEDKRSTVGLVDATASVGLPHLNTNLVGSVSNKFPIKPHRLYMCR